MDTKWYKFQVMLISLYSAVSTQSWAVQSVQRFIIITGNACNMIIESPNYLHYNKTRRYFAHPKWCIGVQQSPHLEVLLNAFIGEVVGCKLHIGAVLNDPTACDMDTHSAACCPVHTKLQVKVNITIKWMDIRSLYCTPLQQKVT